MRWIRPLTPEAEDTADTLGAKAHGLIVLQRLGLPVPPGFVITTEACRAFHRDGQFPDGLGDELAAAAAVLETATRHRLGRPGRSVLVSVRSGASVSMPGMMSTVLNVDLATAHLKQAVVAVFASWDTSRARTYRELHGIPHHFGTAVVVQAMVFGNRDNHSGTGVAFSRDPNTGANVPFGEFLLGHQGDDVVSGTSLTQHLHDLAEHEPHVWADLLRALATVEQHFCDACYLEFTFEAGKLWILQVRRGRFVGAAAIRLAVDLADGGLIGREQALHRVTQADLRHARTPRIVVDQAFARGIGACPGVAAGIVATTADTAVRMAAEGPVILVRPETSPLDLHGIAAAAGIVTARGGPASHAAVVARAMGKPAVVGVANLTVDATGMHAGGHRVAEGTLIAIDGTSGVVVLGSPCVTAGTRGPHLRRLLDWADTVSGDTSERPESERLSAAHRR